MNAALGGLALAVAFVGVASYFVALVRQRAWIRLLSNSGLLLSGMALSQAPSMLRRAQGADAFSIQAGVVLLTAAVLAQSAAALRNRRAWDRTERRTDLLGGRA
ncbi:MAG: hypothetical protein WA840_04490 [Caulobacteraceae bacterium]